MKRMLINATQEEELRMAMVDGQRLYDLNIEAPASERKKANIYKGKITRVEPSLEAAFVDYGAERHGFLPLKEISSEYFVKENKGGGKPNIRDVLKEGQDIVVQVDKEERGNKGAALTTFVSLAGRFIVLKPNKDRSGGVSRRIVGEDRELARKALNNVDIPEQMSVILRTAGIDRTAEELAWDLENLLTVWEAIRNVILERPSPFLVYRESDSVVRALRDYLTTDIGEILIDDEATYKDAYEHVSQTMPHNVKKLKHYAEPVPLFTRYQIESQIESAFAHNVTLPSGGSIVIDHTEALVSIDINSARATKGGDIEATALNTNLEAADEIARQLRIRDLGGLIVIDYIDMGPQKNQREVENRMREAVRQDRARVQIGKISRFGLLEMSRQRLRPSIGESAYKTCPRCTGFGTIRGTESLALAILRIIGEEARKERTSKVIAQLPVEVATYLLNEKRDWVQNLEEINETQVVLVANSHMETPHYDVRRVRDDQMDLPENSGTSFTLAETSAEAESPQAILDRKGVETPAVGTLKPTTPAPERAKPAPPPRKGLWASIVGLFSSDDEQETKKKSQQQRSRSNSSGNRGRRSQQNSRKRNDNRSNESRGNRNQNRRKKSGNKQQARKQPTKDANKKAANAEQQQGKKNQQQNKPNDEQSGDTEQKRTRSRRSRGGRRRRRSNSDKQDTDNAQQNTAKTNGQQQPPVAQDAAAKPQPAKDAPKQQPGNESAKPQSVKEAPKQQSASESAKQEPARKPQRQEAKPAATEQSAPPPSKPKADGPPKARTDAERARDSKTVNDTASHRTPPTAKTEKPPVKKESAQTDKAPKESKPKPAAQDAKPAETKPAPKPPVSDKPAGKLLPWDDA